MHPYDPTPLRLHTLRLIQPVTVDAVPRTKLSPRLENVEFLVLGALVFLGSRGLGRDDGLGGLEWEVRGGLDECGFVACFGGAGEADAARVSVGGNVRVRGRTLLGTLRGRAWAEVHARRLSILHQILRSARVGTAAQRG
jgi:hypothetical protein